jgi:serine/threonine protein kinase
MPEQLLGKYEIQEPLGSGAYADVFRAIDTSLKRTVALKVLKPALLGDVETVQRFLQEAQAAAGLVHPRIAWVWDIGEDQGRHFIAMRYVDGKSLKQLIYERGHLLWDEALMIGKQVTEGLAFAHARGLVHRDIKPHNILISPLEGAVLTDFGLVRAIETSGTLTRTGIMVGTAQYLPPEVWEGEPGSPACDQYALACVMIEMLTGKGPFNAPTPVAVMKKVFSPLVLPQDWPLACNAILAQALAPDPSKRYPNSEVFIKALIEKHESASISPLPEFGEVSGVREEGRLDPAARPPLVYHYQPLTKTAELGILRKFFAITFCKNRVVSQPDISISHEVSKTLLGWFSVLWIILIFAVSWSINWGINGAVGWANDPLLASWVSSGAFSGAIGGGITGLFLKKKQIVSSWWTVLLITWGWIISSAICSGVSWAYALALGPEILLAIPGSLCGMSIGLALYREHILSSFVSVAWITIGWGFGWIFGWIFSAVVLWENTWTNGFIIPGILAGTTGGMFAGLICGMILVWQLRYKSTKKRLTLRGKTA